MLEVERLQCFVLLARKMFVRSKVYLLKPRLLNSIEPSVEQLQIDRPMDLTETRLHEVAPKFGFVAGRVELLMVYSKFADSDYQLY